MATLDTYTLIGSKSRIDKDPDATLDYPFDWSKWLAVVGDTIAAVTWILDSSLTKVSSSFTSQVATVFISGGVLATPPASPNVVPVTCRITTAGGRTEDRTIYLRIIAR